MVWGRVKRLCSVAHARNWGTSMCPAPQTLSVVLGGLEEVPAEYLLGDWGVQPDFPDLLEAVQCLPQRGFLDGEAKERRIVDLEAKLAKATTSAHDWHLKAKDLETQLQSSQGQRGVDEALWPIVSHGLHPHQKGQGVRAVGVRAVGQPARHVASPKDLQ